MNVQELQMKDFNAQFFHAEFCGFHESCLCHFFFVSTNILQMVKWVLAKLFCQEMQGEIGQRIKRVLF